MRINYYQPDMWVVETIHKFFGSFATQDYHVFNTLEECHEYINKEHGETTVIATRNNEEVVLEYRDTRVSKLLLLKDVEEGQVLLLENVFLHDFDPIYEE